MACGYEHRMPPGAVGSDLPRAPRGLAAAQGAARPEKGGVLPLHDAAATDAALTGAKAANLARAAAAGLPVLPGFVITTKLVARIDAGDDQAVLEAGHGFERLKARAERLVVRSSSTVEDLGTSSMAGRFESVLGVETREDFIAAVGAVLDSRARAAEGNDELDPDHAIAVLVQPQVDPSAGGVMFGVDPVTGRDDVIVVTAVAGGPDALVSGAAQGARYELDGRGRVLHHDEGESGARLRRRDCRQLAELATRVADHFGEPQDVEWALHDGKLWLLQARPVTTPIHGKPTGPLLGPGPVAETFPDGLWPLEEDMWLPPLRDGLRIALRFAGASPAQLHRSPVVVAIDGRVAVDLDLLGEGEPPSRLAALDPRPKLRRLRAAWRVGRLRAAGGGIADDTVRRTDRLLLAVPSLDELSVSQLLALLDRAQAVLRSLHGFEMLLGLTVDDTTSHLTGIDVALRVLARAREEGLDDDEIRRRYPTVLALTSPRIGDPNPLPGDVASSAGHAPEQDEDTSRVAIPVLREALRLRVRWAHELMARAALQLGRELLVPLGMDPCDIRSLHYKELLTLAVDGDGPPPLDDRSPSDEPLPARFRRGTRGGAIPVGGAASGAQGAGGGVCEGIVHQGEHPPEGAVLVVRNLDPALATILPRIAGLVAETGAVLAHVAILARETGVATVVGAAGAMERYPPGTRVRLDGSTGEIEVLEEVRTR